MKKVVSGLVLLAVVCGVLFLTFQGPHETVSLSETVRMWIAKMGYSRGPLEFRSDFHLIEYFILGVVIAVFCKEMKWKPWTAGITGCCFGLAEETIKIFLPTREFGGIDLIKDFIGVWVAVAIVHGVSRIKKSREDGNE